MALSYKEAAAQPKQTCSRHAPPGSDGDGYL